MPASNEAGLPDETCRRSNVHLRGSAKSRQEIDDASRARVCPLRHDLRFNGKESEEDAIAQLRLSVPPCFAITPYRPRNLQYRQATSPRPRWKRACSNWSESSSGCNPEVAGKSVIRRAVAARKTAAVAAGVASGIGTGTSASAVPGMPANAPRKSMLPVRSSNSPTDSRSTPPWVSAGACGAWKPKRATLNNYIEFASADIPGVGVLSGPADGNIGLQLYMLNLYRDFALTDNTPTLRRCRYRDRPVGNQRPASKHIRWAGIADRRNQRHQRLALGLSVTHWHELRRGQPHGSLFRLPLREREQVRVHSLSIR